MESKYERVTSKCTRVCKMSANEKPRCPGSPQVTTKCPDPCPAVPQGKPAKLHIIEAVAVDARPGPEPQGQIRALSGPTLRPMARVSFLLPGS